MSYPDRVALLEGRRRHRAASADGGVLAALASAAACVAPAWASVEVETTAVHLAYGLERTPGARYWTDARSAEALERSELAATLPGEPERYWHLAEGRDLTTAPTDVPTVRPVVACLNLWNDAPALRRTAPSWLPHVAAVVVADGPYRSTGIEASRSDDGGPEWLQAHHAEVTVLGPDVDGPWPDQPGKRTRLLQVAAAKYPDAVLFVVDADEYLLHGGEALGRLDGDVGWITISSPLYRRRYGQPRLVLARPGLGYQARHHWLMCGERLLATHQYGGTGFAHRCVPVVLRNERGLGHTAARRHAKRRHLVVQATRERGEVADPSTAGSDTKVGGRESLRILQLTTYDAGLVGFRLHSAINRATPHASLFAAEHARNAFAGPSQFDLDDELTQSALGRRAREADILHCHLDYSGLRRIGAADRRPVVIHHHGTLFRRMPQHWAMEDALFSALRLVSNTELLQYGEGLHYLPNPMPVARYRRLRASVQARNGHEGGGFRIAHSPSKRALKGTEDLMAAVATLNAKGLKVTVDLIEGVPHADSLQRKAAAHCVFDSFWLGMQCSGLEGAAMGLPVIAGDLDCRREYEKWLGAVPYTWANDRRELVEVIERMIVEPTWREAEAARVADYTLRFHDEAAVALRYLDLLDTAFHWRDALSLERRREGAGLMGKESA